MSSVSCSQISTALLTEDRQAAAMSVHVVERCPDSLPQFSNVPILAVLCVHEINALYSFSKLMKLSLWKTTARFTIENLKRAIFFISFIIYTVECPFSLLLLFLSCHLSSPTTIHSCISYMYVLCYIVGNGRVELFRSLT